ncbi:hypothetical protein [Azospirillum sp. sgz302134]
MEEQWLLKAKFTAFNLTAIAFVLVLYLQGWLDRVLTGHIAVATAVIATVFLIGLFMSAYRVWKIGGELDNAKAGAGRMSTVESERALEIRLFSRISHLQHIANALGMLGLIGTAWGFSLFAANITPDMVGNASSAGAMVTTLASGLGVAIYATMMGGALCLWTTCNLQLLRGATASLCALIMDEAHARRRMPPAHGAVAPDSVTFAKQPAAFNTLGGEAAS